MLSHVSLVRRDTGGANRARRAVGVGVACIVLAPIVAYLGYVNEVLFPLLWAALFVSIALYVFARRLRMTLLVCLGVILSLSCFETATSAWTWLTVSGFPHFSEDSDYPLQYYDSSDLGSQGRPGVHRSLRLSSKGAVIYDVTYTIGEDRFRVTPGQGGRRGPKANFFGGSLMIGEGLEDTETLPYLVSQELPGYRAKNFGSHGFGVHQALAILESDRDTTGEVTILLTAPWHAERMKCIPHQSSPWTPVYALAGDGGVVRDGNCLEAENAPPQGLSRATRILNGSTLGQLVRDATRDGDEQDGQLNIYLAMVKQLSMISNQRQQRLIVGFVRADERFFAGEWTNDSILGQLCDWGIETVDLTLADRNEDVPEVYYIHAEERHPSLAANRERAALLADRLSPRP